MDARERHLRLLTETIEAVNSTLDLQEVLVVVATKVADALEADACFVYLYDERADELVLRATHGTPIDEMTRRPRMRPGEGITGSAAAARAPVMLETQAHLDPRFKNFPNLPEDEYESILAVPILTRDGTLEGALNVRTREPRAFSDDEVELLLAIAAQVAQSIEHAKLYSEAQRRVHELEALARISEAVQDSLYLEESLEAIVKTTMDALGATGAALVLDDGRIAWPEGVASTHAMRQPLRWRGRQIGELVADRATPFSEADRELLASIATHAAVALEHGRAVMRGVLAQEIHHRVKNNLQTVASLLRLQARSADAVDPREALEHSVNRILAIAAVHELLTERREEDVDLADLFDRLRAMLVQGVGGGKEVSATLDVGDAARRARDRARARVRGAAAERARARRRPDPRRARAAERRPRPRDRRRRRRARRCGVGDRALDRARARPRRAARDARALVRARRARRGRLPRVTVCAVRCRAWHWTCSPACACEQGSLHLVTRSCDPRDGAWHQASANAGSSRLVVEREVEVVVVGVDAEHLVGEDAPRPWCRGRRRAVALDDLVARLRAPSRRRSGARRRRRSPRR